jgi:hypothetical protein
MSQVVTCNVTSKSVSNQNPPATVVGASPRELSSTVKCNLQNGTAADQMNQRYRAKVALAAAPVTINLFDGSLKDDDGNALAMRHIKRLRVRNPDTANTVAMSGGASNPLVGFWNSTGVLTLQPSTAGGNDGWYEATAPGTGVVVSAGSNTIKFDPGANSITVEVEIDAVDA